MVLRRLREGFRRLFRPEPRIRREEVREDIIRHTIERARRLGVNVDENVLRREIESHPEIERHVDSVLRQVVEGKRGKNIMGAIAAGLVATGAIFTGPLAPILMIVGGGSSAIAAAKFHADASNYERKGTLYQRHVKEIAERLARHLQWKYLLKFTS